MTKRKGFVFLLSLCFLLTALTTGCGSEGSSDLKTPTSVAVDEKSAEESNSVSEDSEIISSESNDDIETVSEDQEPEETADSNNDEATIEEAVLFDQDGIVITAKELDMDDIFGPEISLLIENNTEKSITVQTRNASVNGYMVETMMSADVAAGKKANDGISILSSDLKAAGIDTIADIEFSFYIMDTESWDTICESEMIRIETSAIEGFEYTYDNSGEQVFNENGIEIVVKGLSEDDEWMGPAVVVYISNTSGQNLTIQARDVSINGFMVESIFSADILDGKHAIDTITFMSSDLEDNGIESIENIELYFTIANMETWDTVVDTSMISIQF